MRVYHTRLLLRVIEGTEDVLLVRGRLGLEITRTVEAWLRQLPRDAVTMFNWFATLDESLDYASEPIVYMPDEFAFHIDAESLGRLAREVLVWSLPMDASVWESKHDMTVADLWLGGQGEVSTADQRSRPQQTMREIWAMPVH